MRELMLRTFGFFFTVVVKVWLQGCHVLEVTYGEMVGRNTYIVVIVSS